MLVQMHPVCLLSASSSVGVQANGRQAGYRWLSMKMVVNMSSVHVEATCYKVPRVEYTYTEINTIVL